MSIYDDELDYDESDEFDSYDDESGSKNRYSYNYDENDYEYDDGGSDDEDSFESY